MKLFSTILFVCLNIISAQELKEIKEDDYSFKYSPHLLLNYDYPEVEFLILTGYNEKASDKFADNLSLVKIRDSITLAKYLDLLYQNKSSFGNIQIMKKVILKNKEFIRIIFETKINNFDITTFQHVFIGNDHIYQITATIENADLYLYKKDFLTILNSFELNTIN